MDKGIVTSSNSSQTSSQALSIHDLLNRTKTHNELIKGLENSQKSILEESGNETTASANNELADKRKKSGTVLIKGLVVNRSKPFKKTSFDGLEYDSYYLNIRVSKSISEDDMNSKEISFFEDPRTGVAYYLMPTYCDLSTKKLKEKLASESISQSDDHVSKSNQQTKQSDSKKRKVDKMTSSTKQPLITDITDKKVDQQEESAPKKLKNDKGLAIVPVNKVSNSDKSQKTSPIQKQQTDPPEEETEKNIDRNNQPIVTGHMSDDENVEETIESTHILNPAYSLPIKEIYEFEELQNKPYIGQSTRVKVKLPINQQVGFGMEETASKTPPESWSIIQAEIKPNPYIQADGTYKLDNWSVVKIVEYRPLDSLLVYKYFEYLSSRHKYSVMMSEYYELEKKKGISMLSEKDKLRMRFNDENTLILVVGNTLTAPEILSTTDEGHHVHFSLERIVDVTKFSIVLKDDVVKPCIPYKFICTQWTGSGAVGKEYRLLNENPTLMKFEILLNIKYTHVCPDKEGPTLGINSITAWNSLLPSIYSQIKMAIIAVEDSKATANNGLNAERYEKCKMQKEDNESKQKRSINSPFENQWERTSHLRFVLVAVAKQVILLPLHSLKSCLIRIPESYIYSDTVWGINGKKRPFKILDTMGKKSMDGDGAHCLSELTDITNFFINKPSKTNNAVKRYNFYALVNVLYKFEHDENLIRHSLLTEKEGKAYIEALRNIISEKGTLPSLFVKQKSLSDQQIETIPGVGKQEKYINYLKKQGIGSSSILYNIDSTSITFSGKDTSSLFVYFYAISVDKDDTSVDEPEILSSLIKPVSAEEIEALTGGSITNENEDNNNMDYIENDEPRPDDGYEKFHNDKFDVTMIKNTEDEDEKNGGSDNMEGVQKQDTEENNEDFFNATQNTNISVTKTNTTTSSSKQKKSHSSGKKQSKRKESLTDEAVLVPDTPEYQEDDD